MPSTCVFEFDRPEPIYYAGEVIKGRIILNTTSIKTVNEICILFSGEAKVHWKKINSRTTTDYRGKKTYLNSRTVVHGEGDLPVGTHTYTCSIPLPVECPTSCVEKYGKIFYELSLIIDRPWRFHNNFSQPITVLQTFDLNQNPEYLIPMKQEAIKHFCCWPCSSGSMISTLTIPFGGFAPGQDIDYTLQIDNQSSGYDLDRIEVQLKQTYRFVADSPYRKTRKRINILAETAQNERVLRLSKRVITGALTIPTTLPTSQDEGIIMIHYTLVMIIKTDDCMEDAIIDMPITIGTIPLEQNARGSHQVYSIMSQTSNKNDPPTFEEAITMSDNFSRAQLQ